jgi:adhesin HecA-like repeat protein
MSGAAGPAAQTLTQTARYDNSQTFYAHVLTVGAVTLTASRYDNSQTFYTHVLTQNIPSQNLSQTSRYDNSQTYYTHTLTVGSVTLTPSRFDNAQTFYSHTLTPGAVTLSPSRFDNAQTFYAHTLTVGAVTLTPARFDNQQTFYTHELTNSGGLQILTQSARFDNSQTYYSHEIIQQVIGQNIYGRYGRRRRKLTKTEREKIVDSIQIRLKQQLIEADVPLEQAKEIVSKVTKEVRSDLKTEVFEGNFEADLLEYDVALNKTRAIIQTIIDAELDDEETILMLM